jgi:hypothetical protein
MGIGNSLAAFKLRVLTSAQSHRWEFFINHVDWAATIYQ